MKNYVTEAIRLFVKVKERQYRNIVMMLAGNWRGCVIQARIYDEGEASIFKRYMKKDNVEYTREISIGAALEFDFVYNYELSEFRYR